MPNKQRRKLIKATLLSGGAVLGASAVRAQFSRDGSSDSSFEDRNSDGDRDRDGDPPSPPTRPFVVPLPIPPIAQPVAPFAADIGQFQRYSDFPAQKFYDIDQREALHSFHPDLPLNPIWGYNGISPGPTFIARYGEPMLVRFRNNLPINSVGFGSPETSIHLHNGHTASESDGFAGDFFPAGTFKDNHYPNVLAGFVDGFAPNGDPREALGTLWYHDHRVDFTAPNVYKGLAAFYFLFDNLDTGNETTGLRLPSGAFDVPLMFADKRFDASGQLFFNQFDTNGFVGDKFTVNGKIQPFFRVARRKYRFRMLNAGPSRFYEFTLSNGQPFIQIANDGNLLPKPISRSALRIAPAERVDVILDFSSAAIGTQIFVQNRLRQDDGRGPSSRNLDTPVPILRFDVDRDVADPSQIPATLRTLPPKNTSEAVATRTWRFQNRNGAWAINDRFFDVNRVDAKVKRGTAEIWVLKNEFRDWSHPIHIHLEEFQILSRNGSAPPADEVARKDVVRLRQGEEVKVFIRFRDWLGKYMMHCHNTVHEDHAMMIRFDVVP